MARERKEPPSRGRVGAMKGGLPPAFREHEGKVRGAAAKFGKAKGGRIDNLMRGRRDEGKRERDREHERERRR